MSTTAPRTMTLTELALLSPTAIGLAAFALAAHPRVDALPNQKRDVQLGLRPLDDTAALTPRREPDEPKTRPRRAHHRLLRSNHVTSSSAFFPTRLFRAQHPRTNRAASSTSFFPMSTCPRTMPDLPSRPT